MKKNSFNYYEIPDLNNEDELVKYFIPLATKLARQFCNKARYYDVDEYISHAIASLPELCRKIESKQTAYSYVRKSLNGLLQNYLRDRGRRVKLPRPILDLHGKVRNCRRKTPGISDLEIKETLNISDDKWDSYTEAMNLRFTPLVDTVPYAEKNNISKFSEENKKKIQFLENIPSDIFEEMERVYLGKGKVIKPKYKKRVSEILEAIK